MGASVTGYWPGISERHFADQPSFYNDCGAWTAWMVEREQHPQMLAEMRKAGLGPLLTLSTEGVSEADIEWVLPRDLATAASRLQVLLGTGGDLVEAIVETYGYGANNIQPPAEELAQDLDDIIKIAGYAEKHGVPRMTLEVNW